MQGLGLRVAARWLPQEGGQSWRPPAWTAPGLGLDESETFGDLGARQVRSQPLRPVEVPGASQRPAEMRPRAMPSSISSTFLPNLTSPPD